MPGERGLISRGRNPGLGNRCLGTEGAGSSFTEYENKGKSKDELDSVY